MTATHYVGGIHAVRSALLHGKDNVKQVWLEHSRRDKRSNEIESTARELGVPLSRVHRKEIEQLLGSNYNHQGVAAEVRQASSKTEQDLFALMENLQANAFLLILDGVTDPHNLGACLRTADAAGVNAVIAPKDKSVGLTPVAVKVACGAADSVPYIQVTNLARTMEKLKQDYAVWVYGAAGEAQGSVYQQDFSANLALVMGAEGKGMRRLTREHCDTLFALPMQGQVESLNVSVATGICLYEVVRQRSGEMS